MEARPRTGFGEFSPGVWRIAAQEQVNGMGMLRVGISVDLKSVEKSYTQSELHIVLVRQVID